MMWKQVRALLKGLDPVRIENKVQVGTPDINYIHGWIELKYKKQWPRNLIPLRLKHFTPMQRAWLIRRSVAGGKAFVLLKVENEWLLFDGPIAAKLLGHLTRQELYQVAIKLWHQTPNQQELQNLLSN